MTPPVMIRLEIDQMKYQIMHAFTLHQTEIAAQVQAALDKPLGENLDIEALVTKVVQDELPKVVSYHVQRAISKLLYDADITRAVEEALAVTLNSGGKPAATDQQPIDSKGGNAR